MLWIYNIAVRFYGLIVRIFSLFNAKASLFIKGRQNVFGEIKLRIDPSHKHIWFHFASLGEFEQGRPVLEKLKKLYPHKRIIITFFSPSGYEVRKNYPLAEGVFYLPLDTPSNAKKLIELIHPKIAVFTKYEYWYHYFKILDKNKVPIFIISAIFRPDQIYFKWYGNFNRKILRYVDRFFVQNEESKHLLNTIHLKNVSLSGDTRFDRVAENASSPVVFPLVEKFCGTAPVFIAGSTWFPDEQLLAGLITENPTWKWIIAPHETDADHIGNLQKLLPESIKYADLQRSEQKSQVLIIDSVGLLSSLYQYGKVAYIGGGFGAGIHNTLEAAAFGMPVIFGPKYGKFQEAKDLIALGAAISVQNQTELQNAFKIFTENNSLGNISKNYVAAKVGATDQIIDHISRFI